MLLNVVVSALLLNAVAGLNLIYPLCARTAIQNEKLIVVSDRFPPECQPTTATFCCQCTVKIVSDSCTSMFGWTRGATHLTQLRGIIDQRLQYWDRRLIYDFCCNRQWIETAFDKRTINDWQMKLPPFLPLNDQVHFLLLPHKCARRIACAHFS